MVVASLILVLSGAMLCFYLQTVCQRILHREFDREYFLPIANANRLEFPAVRRAIEEFEAPLEYARFRMMLKCDYIALTYLLKNAANTEHRYTGEERLLMAYYHLNCFWLQLRHFLHMDEKGPVLQLTTILQYFGNVVGRRVGFARFGDLSASDYLLTL